MSRATSEAIFIGATIKAAPGSLDYLSIPSAPSNYGAVAAQDFVNKKMQARREAMALPPVGFEKDNPLQRPLTGSLHSVYIWDRAGYPLHTAVAKPSTQPGSVAKSFVRYMLETFPRQFSPHLAHGDTENHTLIFGFGVDEILRIAAFEVIKQNASLAPESRLEVPVRFWYNTLGVYDPFEVALSASHRKDIDIDGLFKFIGSSYRSDTIRKDAEAQALAAEELVEALGMVPAGALVG